MEIETISMLIGEVGFPIVVSIALFIQNNRTIETFNELKLQSRENAILLQQLIDRKGD